MTTAINILNNEKDPEFRTWFYILEHSSTKAWEQPVLTFIDRLKEKSPNGKIKLSDKKIKYCNYFMRGLARYIYAKKLDDEPKDGLTIKQEMLNLR
jgi:hypothetical protein